eukprot:922496-Prorocentrum_minimum.AAC.5
MRQVGDITLCVLFAVYFFLLVAMARFTVSSVRAGPWGALDPPRARGTRKLGEPDTVFSRDSSKGLLVLYV